MVSLFLQIVKSCMLLSLALWFTQEVSFTSVHFRIDFRILVMVYECFYGLGPSH